MFLWLAPRDVVGVDRVVGLETPPGRSQGVVYSEGAEAWAMKPSTHSDVRASLGSDAPGLVTPRYWTGTSKCAHTQNKKGARRGVSGLA